MLMIELQDSSEEVGGVVPNDVVASGDNNTKDEEAELVVAPVFHSLDL